MSQQSLALATSKETEHQDIDHRREIQEAMLWYNMVLGFKIEGGRVLACDPQLNDTKQLIHELNKTNGLFKFVRKLREKFQEAAPLGFLPQSTTLHQETTISVSAPVFSDVSESPSTTSQTSDELKRNSKRSRHGRGGRQAIMSPVSVRRSPRFKGKK
nr:unknown [Populus trichocarpa]